MYAGGYRPGPQKRCWCGSGKKKKNCHGKRVAARAAGAREDRGVAAKEIKPDAQFAVGLMGVPGEEHELWVQPIMKGQQPPVGPVNLSGNPGPYRVQFLLARPGYPITKEREHKFIDNIVGDSHIRIIKPIAERRLEDPDRMLLAVGGKNFRFECITNEKGFLGKIIVDLTAKNTRDAVNEAYGSIAPFLSAWSLNLDIPVHVETIQVTDLTTLVSALRVRAPHLEMNWGGGGSLPFFQEEFCQYASVYREGLNSSSAFYRFLCFFKVIESIIGRRGREFQAKRATGQEARRAYEVIPATREEILVLLKKLYPWRDSWDDMTIGQTFPPESLGKKVTFLKEKYLYGIRCGIAHALLERGEVSITLDKIEHIQEINKWLPLCRIIARWMLISDFPTESTMGVK